MPRLVLDRVQRAVASTAARIVAPSGRSPAAASAGPMATALARKSSYRVSWKWRPGETLPGLGALTSSRQASCAGGGHLRRGRSPRWARARWSTSAPATSTPVACCSPSQPGMPFTSST